MKIVKYGHGMKCQKWYKTECSHCHTIFKASPFEVAFIEYDEETTHRVRFVNILIFTNSKRKRKRRKTNIKVKTVIFLEF